MDLHALKRKIDRNPRTKQLLHRLIMSRRGACPRRWVKWFVNPLFFFRSKGKKAKIRRHVIMNISPINPFTLGSGSVIEYFSVVDNGVGAVHIGRECRIGLRNTLIGPVRIGDHTIVGQNVVLSGLNHNYQDVEVPVNLQGVSVAPITIGDGAWIGANSIITAGVHIGNHSIVAGGSAVTKDVPDYSLVGGNPARVIKRYDAGKKEWIKTAK